MVRCDGAAVASSDGRRGSCSRASGGGHGRHERDDRRSRSRCRRSFRRSRPRHLDTSIAVAEEQLPQIPSSLLRESLSAARYDVDAEERPTAVDVHPCVAHRDDSPAEVRAARQRHICEKPLVPIAVACVRSPISVTDLPCASRFTAFVAWTAHRSRGRISGESMPRMRIRSLLRSWATDEDRVAVDDLGDYCSCCHGTLRDGRSRRSRAGVSAQRHCRDEPGRAKQTADQQPQYLSPSPEPTIGRSRGKTTCSRRRRPSSSPRRLASASRSSRRELR